MFDGGSCSFSTFQTFHNLPPWFIRDTIPLWERDPSEQSLPRVSKKCPQLLRCHDQNACTKYEVSSIQIYSNIIWTRILGWPCLNTMWNLIFFLLLINVVGHFTLMLWKQEIKLGVTEGSANWTEALNTRNFSNFDNISGLPGREVLWKCNLLMGLFFSFNLESFLKKINLISGHSQPCSLHSIAATRDKVYTCNASYFQIIWGLYWPWPDFLLRFFEAVCMKSAFMVQRPKKLFIHSDTGPPTGRWN